MIVFGMEPEGNILRVVQGEKIGTLVSVGLTQPHPPDPSSNQRSKEQP